MRFDLYRCHYPSRCRLSVPFSKNFKELTNTVNFQNQQIATLELNIANQKQITLSTLQSVFQQVQQPESVGTSINAQLTTENQLTAQNNALLQFLQNQTAQMSAALQNAQIATTSDAQAQDLQPVWDQGIIYPVVAGGNITEDSDLTQPSSLSVDQINLFLQNTPRLAWVAPIFKPKPPLVFPPTG